MSDENEPSHYAQILQSIKAAPKRWSELKESTGLSKATLYRYLTDLEKEDKITRVYQKGGIKWKITKTGKKKVFINSLSSFLKKTNEIPLKVSLIFDHFEPLTEAELEENKQFTIEIEEKMRKDPDRDFTELEEAFLRKKLLEGADKALLKQLKTHKALLSMTIKPSIFVLDQPRDAKDITKFMRKVVEFVDSNKEELVSSLFPEKSATHGHDNYFTSEAEILIRIEFEASEKLEDKLKKPAGLASTKQDEEIQSAGT